MNEQTTLSEQRSPDLSKISLSEQAMGGLTEILQYLETIRKRWPLVVIILSTTLVIGTIYTLRAAKLYKATASVVISPRTPQILKDVQDVNPMSSPYADEVFLQTEYAVIESRRVAERTAERLNLRNDDVHNGLGQIKDVKKREEARQKFDAYKFVKGMIKVVPKKRSQIVEIEVLHEDPKFAADMANAVANSYIEGNVEKRVDGTRDASSWLVTQHDELKKKLNDSEDALYAFMTNNGILNASLESQVEEIKSRLGQFISKLAEIQSKRIASQLDARALEQAAQNPEMINTLPEVQNLSVISTLKDHLSQLQAQYSQLEQKYQPAHPKLVALAEQIETLKTNLKTELGATVNRLERDQRSLANTEQGLKEAIEGEREREAHMNKLSLEYNRYKRDVETNTKLYEMVATRLKEIDLTGMLKANNVSVLDAALVPRVPFKPSWRNNLLIALMLGLLLGVGTVILLDILDTTLKTQEDVEAALGLPFLGVMPVIESGGERTDKKSRIKDVARLRECDLYIMHHPKSMPAECSRAIRTNLHFMSPDKPLKSLAVTSSMPREGKSTTSISLATTMAQAGSRVLLVDADLRRPRLHRTFSVSNDVGISSLIVGEAKLEDAIQHTELAGLDLLTCGPIPPNPSELLHTERFKELVKEFEKHYDKVIFDAPPVGAVTDPVILGAQVDGTILVVKTAYTSRDSIRRALRTLVDAHVPVLGVILNDIDVSAKKYGYYYGKYYRYGRYYGQYHYGETTEVANPA